MLKKIIIPIILIIGVLFTLTGCSQNGGTVLNLVDLLNSVIKSHGAVSSFVAKGDAYVDGMVHMPEDVGGDRRLTINGKLGFTEVGDKTYSTQEYHRELMDNIKDSTVESYLVPTDDGKYINYYTEDGENWHTLDVVGYTQEKFIDDVLKKMLAAAEVESKTVTMEEEPVNFNGIMSYKINTSLTGDMLEPFANLFLFNKDWLSTIDYNLIYADCSLYIDKETKDVIGLTISFPSFGDFLMQGLLSKSLLDLGTTWEINDLNLTFTFSDFNNAADIIVPKEIVNSAIRAGTQNATSSVDKLMETENVGEIGINLSDAEQKALDEKTDILTNEGKAVDETELDLSDLPLPSTPTEDAVYILYTDPSNHEESQAILVTDIPASNTVTAQEDYIAIINNFENKGQENLYYDYKFSNKKLSDAIEDSENVTWMSANDGYSNIKMGDEQTMTYELRSDLVGGTNEYTVHYVRTEFDFDDGVDKLHHLEFDIYIELEKLLLNIKIDNYGERVAEKENESIISVILDHLVIMPTGALVEETEGTSGVDMSSLDTTGIMNVTPNSSAGNEAGTSENVSNNVSDTTSVQENNLEITPIDSGNTSVQENTSTVESTQGSNIDVSSISSDTIVDVAPIGNVGS